MERISPTSDLYEVVFRRHPDPKFSWIHNVFEVYLASTNGALAISSDVAKMRASSIYGSMRVGLMIL
jgi:hypothetical protein